MVQHGRGDVTDVLEADGRPPRQQRRRPGRFGDGDRRPGRRAVGDVVADALGGLGRLAVAGRHQPRDVTRHRPGQEHAIHHRKQRRQLIGRHRPRHRRRLAPTPRGNDLFQNGHLRAGDLQLEQEPVELRLGQRIRAFQLDGVLRGQHEKRPRQRTGRAHQRDRPLLHGLQQGRLGLGRCAVDLVGQKDVREHRAGLEDPLAVAAVDLLQDVRADNIGRHEIGRELHAGELQGQHVAQRLDHRRLADARNALEQQVPAAENADHDHPVKVRTAQQHAVQLLQRVVGQLEGRLEFLRLKNLRGWVCHAHSPGG